jgi:hypothetical protein
MTTPRRALLLQAADAVDGDRNQTYGGPESSFTTIATLWNEYLRVVTTVPGDALQPHDVAAMLALLKIARIAGSGGTHKDSWLDLAGYAACGWETVDVPADMEPAKERAVQDCLARAKVQPYNQFAHAEVLKKIQELSNAYESADVTQPYNQQAVLDAMQPIGPGTLGWQGVK